MSAYRLAAIEAAIRADIKAGQAASILEDLGRNRMQHEDTPTPVDPDTADRQCAWADYRKDYGVSESDMVAAHKAFMAGWKSAREGDQSGPLR